jgi:predicted AAA+ superfamily ATPase
MFPKQVVEASCRKPPFRMPCMLIYGVCGAGKTMLLEKVQRDHAQSFEERSGRGTNIAYCVPLNWTGLGRSIRNVR